MALISSVSLAFVVNGLKPMHDQNEAVFKKKEILNSIKDQIGINPTTLSSEEVNKIFAEKVEKVVIDATGKKVFAHPVAFVFHFKFVFPVQLPPARKIFPVENNLPISLRFLGLSGWPYDNQGHPKDEYVLCFFHN